MLTSIELISTVLKTARSWTCMHRPRSTHRHDGRLNFSSCPAAYSTDDEELTTMTKLILTLALLAGLALPASHG
jgi:hypothetical protein